MPHTKLLTGLMLCSSLALVNRKCYVHVRTWRVRICSIQGIKPSGLVQGSMWCTYVFHPGIKRQTYLCSQSKFGFLNICPYARYQGLYTGRQKGRFLSACLQICNKYFSLTQQRQAASLVAQHQSITRSAMPVQFQDVQKKIKNAIWWFQRMLHKSFWTTWIWKIVSSQNQWSKTLSKYRFVCIQQCYSVSFRGGGELWTEAGCFLVLQVLIQNLNVLWLHAFVCQASLYSNLME